MTNEPAEMLQSIYPDRVGDFDRIHPGLSASRTSREFGTWDAKSCYGKSWDPTVPHSGGNAGTSWNPVAAEMIDFSSPRVLRPRSADGDGDALDRGGACILLNHVDIKNGWSVWANAQPSGQSDAHALTYPHTHDQDQFVILLEGEMDVTINAGYGHPDHQITRVSAGGTSFNPYGSPYWRQLLPPAGGLLVEVRHAPWHLHRTFWVVQDPEVWLRSGTRAIKEPHPKAAPVPGYADWLADREIPRERVAEMLATIYPGDAEDVYPGLGATMTSDRYSAFSVHDIVDGDGNLAGFSRGIHAGTAGVALQPAVGDGVDLRALGPLYEADGPGGVRVLLNQIDVNGWSVVGIHEPAHGPVSDAGVATTRRYEDADHLVFVFEGSLRYGDVEIGPNCGAFLPALQPYTRISGPEGARYMEIRHVPWHHVRTTYTAADPALWLQAGA